MDEESLRVLEFCFQNVSFLGRIYSKVYLFEFDENLDSDIYKRNQEEYDKSIIQNLENFGELIILLKNYVDYLEKNKIDIIKSQKDFLILILHDWIEEFEGEKHKEKDIQISYSRLFLKETLYTKYSFIFNGTREMLTDLRRKIGTKLETFYEMQKLTYPEFEKDIQDIYNLHSGILQKLKSDNSKEFLQSAKASFQYGIVQLIQAEFGTLRFIDSSEDMKTQVYSHITSCLFLLIAAYDKIIFSIGYNLSIPIVEDQTYIKDVLIGIQSVDKNLHKNLTESDRQDFLKIARKLRNSATHRISNYSPKELNGYTVSVIKEIYRILNIFNASVK